MKQILTGAEYRERVLMEQRHLLQEQLEKALSMKKGELDQLLEENPDAVHSLVTWRGKHAGLVGRQYANSFLAALK